MRLDRWTVLFLSLALVETAAAIAAGGFWWLLLWPAGAHLLLGLAFLTDRPSMLGKLPDGTRSLVRRLALAPYTLFLTLFHRIAGRYDERERPLEVVPGVFLSGRARPSSIPPGLELIVDVASELPALVRPGEVDYVRVSCLNRRVPILAEACQALRRLEQAGGPVLVHCGAGKGRSAALVAALLLRRGFAADVDTAEEILRRVKPGVRLHPAQRRFVDRLVLAAEASDSQSASA